MLFEESAHIRTYCTLTLMERVFGNHMEQSCHLMTMLPAGCADRPANDFSYRRGLLEWSLVDIHVFILLCNSPNIAV